MDKIKELSLNKKCVIGIGLGPSNEYLIHMKKVLSLFSNIKNIKIKVIHNYNFKPQVDDFPKNIELIHSENPSYELINLLLNNDIDGIVRGSISSSEFLKSVKKLLEINKISRIALLGTAWGKDFFFSPVGIDEGRTIEDKIFFAKQGYNLLKRLEIQPSIAILSGGRLGDLGRDKIVDNTINNAIKVVDKLKNDIKNIFHSEILIENAIKKANYIIAPDGISGNLIYRTLVHLGNGYSYGAIYIEPYLKKKVIIDTSRVGPINEHYSAILMAAAFSNLL